MKRWHKEWTIIQREWQKHRLIHVDFNKDWAVGFGPSQRCPGSDPQDVDCACDKQAGRFRKKDAYGCGNTRCWICHSDKYPKRKLSRQELVADLQLEEQTQALWQGDW